MNTSILCYENKNHSVEYDFTVSINTHLSPTRIPTSTEWTKSEGGWKEKVAKINIITRAFRKVHTYQLNFRTIALWACSDWLHESFYLKKMLPISSICLYLWREIVHKIHFPKNSSPRAQDNVLSNFVNTSWGMRIWK